MIKLNKDQVNAIASKITKEYNEEVAKKNKEYNEKVLDKFNKSKEGKLFNAFKETFGENAISSYNQLKNYPELNPFKPINTYSNNITNDVILKTIDCENLDELISSIKKDLIKKTNG